MKRLLAILAVIIIWTASTDSQQPYAETQSAAASDCGIDGFYTWRDHYPEYDDMTDEQAAASMQRNGADNFNGNDAGPIWGRHFRSTMPSEYSSMTDDEVVACMIRMGSSITTRNQTISPDAPLI